MGRIAAFRAVLASLGVVLSLIAPVYAQEPPPVATEETPPPSLELPTEEPPVPLPPGVVTELPYARWSRHIGKAEEAAVLIQVQQNGVTRTATGLVLRCDGFIVVPVWVTEAMKDRASLSVSVTEAENETLSAPLPVNTRTHHATRRVLYGVLKITGHHLRSLPMLNAASIQPGTAVRLVSAQPGKSPGICEADVVPAQVGAVTDKKDQWTLTARHGSSVSLASAAPLGAIVVDEESGAALGIVTQSGESPVFSSFLFFHDVSRDMGIVPSRAILEERRKMPQHLSPEEMGRLKPMNATGGFTWVPGGPVRLWGQLAANYLRAYNTDIACTPGYFIQTTAVTNGEYREWLLQQPVPRRPVGWEQPDELQLARRTPQLPVVEMRQEDAMAYAASQVARLVTDVEWCRASITNDVSWVVETYTLFHQARMRMRQMMEARVAAMNRVAEERRVNKSKEQQFQAALNGFNAPSVPESTTALLLELKNITRLFNGEYPTLVAPVGYRKQDVSIFGVRDVLMNPPEMVQGLSREVPQNRAVKFAPALVDPVLATFSFNRTDDNNGLLFYHVFTVKAALELLKTDTLQVEDRIFLTYYSLVASSGEKLEPRGTGREVKVTDGKDIRISSSGIHSILPGPPHPLAFRMAR